MELAVTVRLQRKAPPEVIASHVSARGGGGGQNTDDLGIEKAGIVHRRNGGYIAVDEKQLQNQCPPAFWGARPICNGRGGFYAHRVQTIFEIVAAKSAGWRPRGRVSDRNHRLQPSITDPPLGPRGCDGS